MNDDDIDALRRALDDLPPPLEPLDVMAVDGYLCGVLLQPRAVSDARWQPRIIDVDGRAPPHTLNIGGIRDAAVRRSRELQRAIDGRLWFDPWIYPLEGDATPTQTVLPWIAGFALALDLFPALTALDEPALIEPLALLYMHIDAGDLEDADDLLAVIETLEPPPDLAEAVQDIVRALMLIADVTRPLRGTPGRRLM